MSSTTTTDFSAYPSDQLTPSEMDHLEVLVDKLILGTKKCDENGRRVDDHRWDPTSFGGGVDIMTIRGVPKLLDQHKAQFGINNNAICVLAKAMAKYAGHCGARDRLESRIESLIKAGLTESSSSSSDASDADDDDDAAPNDAASDDDASDEGEGEGHEHDGDASDDASDQDASGDDASDDDAEDDDNASNSGSGSDSCTSTSVHSKANLITDANSDTDSDSDTDGSSAMLFTQCYNTVIFPLPTHIAPVSAITGADDSCSTSSSSSSTSSELISMSLTPVGVTSRPMVDEPSTTSGANDVEDGNESDSYLMSRHRLPCALPARTITAPLTKLRRGLLLPGMIGKYTPMKHDNKRTPSLIPVRSSAKLNSQFKVARPIADVNNKAQPEVVNFILAATPSGIPRSIGVIAQKMSTKARTTHHISASKTSGASSRLPVLASYRH